MSATCTFAPSEASLSAVARPMPEPAPVTTATPARLTVAAISSPYAFEQLRLGALQGIGERPRIGDELAVDDDAEVDRAVVAHHGEVESDPVHDRRHRIERLHA